MLIATLGILDAAIARWPLPHIIEMPLLYYGLTDAFIVAAMVYDFASHRRISAVYIWGGLLVVSSQWSRDVIGATAAWHAFASAILQ